MTRLLAPLALAATLIAATAVLADGPAAQDASATPPAGDAAPFTAASATRLPDGQIELNVTYEGGACEETGEATVEAGDDITDEVTIPTVSTAEMCTMQIVPVEYSGTIAVEPATTTLAVTVLDPEGRPKAAGSVEIQ